MNIRIGPGEIAVLYTDGITESINTAGEMYGEERLKATIHRYADLPAEDILEMILGSVPEFSGDQPQFDDITLIVIKGVP